MVVRGSRVYSRRKESRFNVSSVVKPSADDWVPEIYLPSNLSGWAEASVAEVQHANKMNSSFGIVFMMVKLAIRWDLPVGE